MIKKYIFDYDTEILETGKKKRFPVAIIHLQGKDKRWYRFQPYLDTGADMSLLTRLDAEILGLKFKQSKEKLIGGVGGGLVKTFIHPVNLKIGETISRVPMAFADSDETPRLLGRRGVFSRFYICFNEFRHQTILVERSREAKKKYGELFE